MLQYQERLDGVLAKFTAGGEGGRPGPVNTTVYEGRIPESIFQLWEKVGLGIVLDGYFQLCDPDQYRPILEQALAGDPDLDPAKTHPIGFSAFGEIVAWNEDHRDVRVDLVNSQVTCRWLVAPKTGIDPNMTILTRLLLTDDESFDPLDSNGKPLFSSVRRRLGRLEAGQIYGFRPILALGGNREAESLVIYEALPHMSILVQARELRLMDMNPYPPQPVRLIGG